MSDSDDTSKDLIAAGSTLGLVLKMMSAVDEATLRKAVDAKQAGVLIGDALVSMRIITADELARALDWQQRMRAAKSFDEVADLLAEVERTERDTRAALFEAIPPTDPNMKRAAP